ncbi:glycoside hydrolase family 1 protein [Patescibacteria group bacterium]
MEKNTEFPKGFLWGTATSSYQVEGGIENSNWSLKYPAGKACDHYNLYEKDFDLMKELNQNAYRFSIEWSKIEPKEGKFDQKEIDHYKEMLKALKKRGISAMATLHHFTIPVWMSEKGGFSNKKSCDYFSRFSNKVFSELKDLVDFWITSNEPIIFASKGYLEKSWPPQKKDFNLFLEVLRNQIVAHKRIYKDFHKIDNTVKVGIAKNNIYFEPAKSSLDRLSVFFARYFWNEYLVNRIQKSLDFIGLNYYFHNKIQFPYKRKNENKAVSDLGWEIYPEGIYHVLKELKRYNLPIYITENGLADKDDNQRIDFIKNHLIWTLKAIQEGIDVRGYFHWSFMDNFEWEKGFSSKFGLVEVDYKTFKRTPRKSAQYFSEISKNNSL